MVPVSGYFCLNYFCNSFFNTRYAAQRQKGKQVVSWTWQRSLERCREQSTAERNTKELQVPVFSTDELRPRWWPAAFEEGRLLTHNVQCQYVHTVFFVVLFISESLRLSSLLENILYVHPR